MLIQGIKNRENQVVSFYKRICRKKRIQNARVWKTIVTFMKTMLYAV